MLTEPEAGSPEFWAAKTPDAIAVISGVDRLSYKEWNDRSNRVADAMSKLGLVAGDRIGMRFRLGLPWFIIQRALQKLGVAQVAVNWKLTPEEALYILKDSGAKGLACDDADAASWVDLDIGLLFVVNAVADPSSHSLDDLLSDGQPVERFGALRPNHILYTSGTTGRPKGVPPVDRATVDPDRLARYLASVNGKLPRPQGARVLMSLPVHHGAGPRSAASACAAGGTAILLDPYDPEEALRLIDQHRIQSWTGVPTMLLRVQALSEETLNKYDLSSIVVLNVGAAPVPQSLKEWIVATIGPGLLWEAYGISEAGMITYMDPKFQLTKPGSSGLPYDCVEIAIVDDEWNRKPKGESGEIAVNTPVVLKNYLGGDPLGEDVLKDGFYRTGDVGHLDEDGFLFITDRIKDMVVAGGVNIYPAEIEKAMLEHEDVADCAVIGIPHDDFGEQILAFVVTAQGKTLDESTIASFLDTKLASFKRPQRYEFVDELPMNPMGKVLKTQLREPYWKGQDRNV